MIFTKLTLWHCILCTLHIDQNMSARAQHNTTESAFTRGGDEEKEIKEERKKIHNKLSLRFSCIFSPLNAVVCTCKQHRKHNENLKLLCTYDCFCFLPENTPNKKEHNENSKKNAQGNEQ